MKVSFMIMGPVLPTYVINDVDQSITIQELKHKILERLKLESNLNITPQNSILFISFKGTKLTDTETLKDIDYLSKDKLFVRLLNQDFIIKSISNSGLPNNIELLPEYIENVPSVRDTWARRRIRDYRNTCRYDDNRELNPLIGKLYNDGQGGGSHRRHRHRHGRHSKKRVTRARKNKRQSRRYAH